MRASLDREESYGDQKVQGGLSEGIGSAVAVKRKRCKDARERICIVSGILIRCSLLMSFYPSFP